MIITALIIVSAFIISFIGLYGYIAWMLGRPNHDALQSNPTLAVGLPYENVSFPSLTGISILNGWFIPSTEPSAKTIVFSHSYAGNREEPWMPIYKIAAALNKKKYNVLMFDYAYANKANHIAFTGGVKEAKDLLGAILFAKQRGAKEVVVWGFSMGAGTTLQAALQTKDINAMILDSTFIATPDTMFQNVKQKLDLPEYPSKMLLHLMFPLLNGSGFSQIPYQKVMSTSYSMPIFFIHGKEDERSPYEIIQHLADNQSANALSSLWLKAKAKHELVYDTDPKAYFKKTMDFIDKVVL
jgi:alpha-beta hydrolase superfamily lysophospholipase